MLFGADSWLEDLDTSPSCKDSGEILDSHLSFNDHMDYLSSTLLGKLCPFEQFGCIGHVWPIQQSPTSVYEGCPFSHPALGTTEHNIVTESRR